MHNCRGSNLDEEKKNIFSFQNKYLTYYGLRKLSKHLSVDLMKKISYILANFKHNRKSKFYTFQLLMYEIQ